MPRKKLYEENLSVLQEENIKRLQASQEDIAVPAHAPRKAKRTRQSAQELETLIKNLQALGFKITPPTSQEDLQRQEESVAKLGFIEKRKTKEAPSTALTCTLGIAHVIAGTVYGPGVVT